MLNPERKSRTKPSNNVYVPPPARQRQEGAEAYTSCDNRAKDRAHEAKLKNSAEETKICNNSSLLFTRDEEEPCSSGINDISKKKRRRKKRIVPSEIKPDEKADPEGISQINTSETIMVQSNNDSPVEYLDEAAGYTPDGTLLEQSLHGMSHEVIRNIQREIRTERDDPKVAGENGELKNLNNETDYNIDNSIGTTESWDEEMVSILPINESVDETIQNGYINSNYPVSNESSLNVSEENHNTGVKNNEPQSKKSPNTKSSLSKGRCNKGTSDKGCIAKRSVEVYEDVSLCTNFRNNDVSKHNSCKSDEANASVEEEDDFEWEKLLDEDFKNLRVTTTFSTDGENLKSTARPSWEREPNDSSVIEIYGFPEEFKTQDILMSFATFANRGFKLKWVDNTHALGIFPSPSIADEALDSALPFVKTRPLSQATTASKEKAKNVILPPALRPQTCSALARRLVSGALGMRAVFTPAEREAERELLKQAREQKRLAAKQRDAAWEGRF